MPEVKLLGFAGYKAGMLHAFVIEDNPNSPNYGKEVFCPVTVIETPPMFICAVRAYEDTPYGKRTFCEAWAKNLPKELGRLITPPKEHDPDAMLRKIEENLDHLCEIRVLACTNPRKAGIGKKKPELMEIAIGGSDVRAQFEYAKSILGREVDVSEVFKEGQYVDVIAVTKGKGFQGPVKRFGVALLHHKSRKTRRGVGCIGPWHPAAVTYTVPRAGQMGFQRRTEYNKRIIAIGHDGSQITPKGGFHKYGVIRSAYILLAGSVPGPAKRLIRLRYPARGPLEAPAPKVTMVVTR